MGLAAWFIPISQIVRKKNTKIGKDSTASILSLGLCAAALYLQLLYNGYLVKLQDWSALMDTSGSVSLVSGILLAGTILLNMVALTRRGKDTESGSN